MEFPAVYKLSTPESKTIANLVAAHKRRLQAGGAAGGAQISNFVILYGPLSDKCLVRTLPCGAGTLRSVAAHYRDALLSEIDGVYVASVLRHPLEEICQEHRSRQKIVAQCGIDWRHRFCATHLRDHAERRVGLLFKHCPACEGCCCCAECKKAGLWRKRSDERNLVNEGDIYQGPGAVVFVIGPERIVLNDKRMKHIEDGYWNAEDAKRKRENVGGSHDEERETKKKKEDGAASATSSDALPGVDEDKFELAFIHASAPAADADVLAVDAPAPPLAAGVHPPPAAEVPAPAAAEAPAPAPAAVEAPALAHDPYHKMIDAEIDFMCAVFSSLPRAGAEQLIYAHNGNVEAAGAAYLDQVEEEEKVRKKAAAEEREKARKKAAAEEIEKQEAREDEKKKKQTAVAPLVRRCPVCLSADNVNMQWMVLTECGHQVCEDCLMSITRRAQCDLVPLKCPLCRIEVKHASKTFFS